jgi:hypothetical protein
MVKDKWINSEAKRLLREDIIAGDVQDRMAPMDVYHMRPEYGAYKFENFRTNLGNLRAAVAASWERMQADAVAYGHDKAVWNSLQHANPRRLQWAESEAKMFLKQDIDEGKHLHLSPSELYATRAEYQEFPLQKFRNHIYQEVDIRAKRAHRYAKKKTRSRAPNR